MGPIVGEQSPQEGQSYIYSQNTQGNANLTKTVTVDPSLGATVGDFNFGGFTIYYTNANPGATGNIYVTVDDQFAPNTPQSESLSVTVQPKTVYNIGTVSVTGNTTSEVKVPQQYEVSYSGNLLDYDAVYSISTTAADADVITDENKINFKSAGTYDVTVTVSSSEATDSPQQGTFSVTVTPESAKTFMKINGDSLIARGVTSYQAVEPNDWSVLDDYDYSWNFFTPHQNSLPQWTGIFTGTGTDTDAEFRDPNRCVDGRLDTYTEIKCITPDVFFQYRLQIFTAGVFEPGDDTQLLMSCPEGHPIGSNYLSPSDQRVLFWNKGSAFTPQWFTLNRPYDISQDSIFKASFDVDTTETWTLRIHAIKSNGKIIQINKQAAAFIFDEYTCQVRPEGEGEHTLTLTATEKNGSNVYTEDKTIMCHGIIASQTSLVDTSSLDLTNDDDPVTTYDTGSLVTVQSVTSGSGYYSTTSNKYFLDGVQQDSVTMTLGETYVFYQGDPSNSGHPLKIYTDSSKSTEVTAGVVISGDVTAFTPTSTGTYSYQCGIHGNMGGSITVN